METKALVKCGVANILALVLMFYSGCDTPSTSAKQDAVPSRNYNSSSSTARRNPTQQSRIKEEMQESSDVFYVRIAIFNDTKNKPISPSCKISINGYEDFYITKDQSWEFGGALIEKAGPFDVNREHILHLYPDNINEIRVPFEFSNSMNQNASVKDMIIIGIADNTIECSGVPIVNATGAYSKKFTRKNW